MAHYVGNHRHLWTKYTNWIVKMTHHDAFCISLNWWKITQIAFGA